LHILIQEKVAKYTRLQKSNIVSLTALGAFYDENREHEKCRYHRPR
jgi:hypothetical protein